ncbi:thioredoxin family protein [Peijinzhouia sedimentorum]
MKIAIYLFCFAIMPSMLMANPPANSAKVAKVVEWVEFEQLDSLIAENPRLIMIDVYATWCGFCKQMDLVTFRNKNVAEQVNQHFYALKLNAESDKKVTFKGITTTEAELAAAFRVQSLPTILFLDETMQEVTPVPGFRNAKDFVTLLDFIQNAYHN